MDNYKEYKYGYSELISIDDIKLPVEVSDYIRDVCECSEIDYKKYPKDLLEQNIIISSWDGMNDNLMFQSFFLHEITSINIFNSGTIFYKKNDDDLPSYMVYMNQGEIKTTTVIKI